MQIIREECGVRIDAEAAAKFFSAFDEYCRHDAEDYAARFPALQGTPATALAEDGLCPVLTVPVLAFALLACALLGVGVLALLHMRRTDDLLASRSRRGGGQGAGGSARWKPGRRYQGGCGGAGRRSKDVRDLPRLALTHARLLRRLGGLRPARPRDAYRPPRRSARALLPRSRRPAAVGRRRRESGRPRRHPGARGDDGAGVRSRRHVTRRPRRRARRPSQRRTWSWILADSGDRCRPRRRRRRALCQTGGSDDALCDRPSAVWSPCSGNTSPASKSAASSDARIAPREY